MVECLIITRTHRASIPSQSWHDGREYSVSCTPTAHLLHLVQRNRILFHL